MDIKHILIWISIYKMIYERISSNKTIQEEALTSFVLYDPYRTNTAHEQYLTSEIRSRIEPSGNTP